MAVRTVAPVTRIAVDAPPDVRAAIETLGRTEDVRFAPSGRRLALASFFGEWIAVAEVEITVSASGPRVALTRLEQLTSPSLQKPHGLEFFDEETLVVACRDAGVALFRLPAAGTSDGVAQIEPLGAVAQGASDGPGSVAVDRHDRRHPGVLACNNWTSTISRHAVEPGWALGAAEVVARKWLDLPDGLTLSHDGRWLAVSNHHAHSVFVYAYPTTGDDAEPVAVLRGALYPHGLRFSDDDRYLLVADAGGPHVQVFAAPDRGWQGVGYPEAAIRVMDDATFESGRHNVEEGGPKGIDIHPETNVLAVTAERVPLAFFDVDAALGTRAEVDDLLLRYELDVLAETIAAKAAAAEDRSQLTTSRIKLELVRLDVDRLLREKSRIGRLTQRLRSLTARPDA